MHIPGLYILIVIALYGFAFFNIAPTWSIYIPLALAFIPAFLHSIKELTTKKIGSEVFLVVATIVGLIGHEEHAVTAVLIIMLIAEYLEDLISVRTELAIKSLVSMIPTSVLARVNNKEIEMPIDAISPGMSLIIKTGKRIPVDGKVIEGSAMVNESTLTGESMPLQKYVGAKVYAGTFVDAGSVVIEVEKIAGDTFFGKITNLVESAQDKKAGIATYADTFASILIPCMLVFIGIVWFITRNSSLVVTLLVFGSPLELTLITPMAVLAGVAAAFRQGILVKGGLCLERFSGVNIIAFDKTGTLTTGEPELKNIEIYNKAFSYKEVLIIVAIAQKRADHVASKAVLKKAASMGIVIPDPQNYISEPGHGIQATINDKNYFIGSRHYIEAPEHGNISFANAEKTDTLFSSFYLASAHDGLIAKLSMADEVRADAKNTIAQLKEIGIKKIILMSGDRQEVVDALAQDLGIDQAFGGLLPDQKISMIENFQADGQKVAMVGDGINDAPALKAAHVGIAMGAMGMEPAIEAADIVLMTNDLSKIVYVYNLSRATLQVIKQNIFVGFVLIHCIGIALAFLNLITPIQAALFHAVPDLLILVNSVRLIRFK